MGEGKRGKVGRFVAGKRRGGKGGREEERRERGSRRRSGGDRGVLSLKSWNAEFIIIAYNMPCAIDTFRQDDIAV